MTNITIKEKTNLQSTYETQRDLAEDLLENLGYVLLWETDVEKLPSEVQKDYKRYKKQDPNSYVDL